MPIQFRQCTLTRTETSKEKQTKINQISAPNGSTETIQIYSLITNYLLAESTMISPNQHMVLAREQVLQLFVPFTSVVGITFREHTFTLSRFALITWEHPTVCPGPTRFCEFTYPWAVIPAPRCLTNASNSHRELNHRIVWQGHYISSSDFAFWWLLDGRVHMRLGDPGPIPAKTENPHRAFLLSRHSSLRNRPRHTNSIRRW